MSNEFELEETKVVETLSDVHNSPPFPIIKIINEKEEQLAEGDTIPKPKNPISLPDNEIITAQKDKTESSPYPAYTTDQGGYGQTPYYQQQQIAGQPVYVQGRPPPEDASRMASYRPRHNDYDYRDNSFIFNETFDDIVIRNRFVQRVYSILAVQLIYTCGFIALCMFSPQMKHLVRSSLLLVYLALFLEFALVLTITCCVSARRNFPLNFILLGLFTMAFAYIMAFMSTFYSTFIVLASLGITAGISLIVSLFACQTSYDVTDWGMFLCVAGLVVMIFGIIAVVVVLLTGSNIMFLIYAGAVALLFSAYLLYDTQMIMGGRRVELSPEEYIFGALTLYVDIMEIFWAILTILGSCSRG